MRGTCIPPSSPRATQQRCWRFDPSDEHVCSDALAKAPPLTLRRRYGSACSMKNQLLPLVTLLLCGCYTTKVYTPAAAQGPEASDRQWFTIGGLVPLSEPTGQECPGGLSKAESKLGGVDILI